MLNVRPAEKDPNPFLAKSSDDPAAAVTDTNNMFCALEFSEGAAKAGVQPIVGCQMDLRYHEPRPGERRSVGRTHDPLDARADAQHELQVLDRVPRAGYSLRGGGEEANAEVIYSRPLTT